MHDFFRGHGDAAIVPFSIVMASRSKSPGRSLIPPKATLQEKLWTKHEAWETILKEVMRPQQPVALVQG